MQARARSYGHDAFDDDYTGEFLPGERIGPPLRSRTQIFLRRALVLLIASGAGWELYVHRETWPGWLAAQTAALYAALERSQSRPAEPVTRLEFPPPLPPTFVPAPRPIASETPPAPALATTATPAPATRVATLPPAAADTAEPSGPLPPPKADPADPLQQRALAVGLHPELSRALLARLSATYYRNAGIAIRTALAETPDNGAFQYPPQRQRDLALFRVHFVQGAPSGCRRYVVTVGKDGWMTTAPPMEKCGAEVGPAARRK
jgi:hypothetical protein